MVDQRFVPKSARNGLGLLGVLALAGAIFGWACTDNSGGGNFVQPMRPFSTADAAADAPSTTDAAPTGAGGAAGGAGGEAGAAGAAGSSGAAGTAGSAGAGGSTI